MTELFLKIYQAFDDNKALFLELGLEPVKHVDKYRGQPLNPAQFEYYDIPAIFIGRKTEWTKVGKSYKGKTMLEFHVVTDATWDTSNISTNKEEGLKNVMYHQLVHYVLDDLETENTGKLQRLDDEPIDTGVVNYEVMKYECAYNDPMITGEEYVYLMIEKLKIAGKLVKNL
ncbi:hypothetical protein [Pedobacter sp. WC2423]|uniref:hypothetical protein n=1 Tax=Pedobacter sp. WC2423 TaxID=3234142 RepID=UPI003465BED1